LKGANLHGTNLRGAVLIGADLRDTLLQNTDLSDADLQGVCVQDIDLTETSPNGMANIGNFDETDSREADLLDTILGEPIVVEQWGWRRYRRRYPLCQGGSKLSARVAIGKGTKHRRIT
jgi:hypothetical protein